jgi:hypothetical protein
MQQTQNFETSENEWLLNELIQGNLLKKDLRRLSFLRPNPIEPWASMKDISISNHVLQTTFQNVLKNRTIIQPNSQKTITTKFHENVYVFNGILLYPVIESSSHAIENGHKHLVCEQFVLFFSSETTLPWYKSSATVYILGERNQALWAKVQEQDWSKHKFVTLEHIQIRKISLDLSPFLHELDDILTKNPILGDIIWDENSLTAADWARKNSWTTQGTYWMARQYQDYQRLRYLKTLGKEPELRVTFGDRSNPPTYVPNLLITKYFIQTAGLCRESYLYVADPKPRIFVSTLWDPVRNSQMFKHLQQLKFNDDPLYDENGILKEVYVHNSMYMYSVSLGWNAPWFTMNLNKTKMCMNRDVSLKTLLDLLPVFRPLKMRRRLAFSAMIPQAKYAFDTAKMIENSGASTSSETDSVESQEAMNFSLTNVQLDISQIRRMVRETISAEFAARDAESFNGDRIQMMEMVFWEEATSRSDLMRLRDRCLMIRSDMRKKLKEFVDAGKNKRKKIKRKGLDLTNIDSLNVDERSWIAKLFAAKCNEIEEQELTRMMFFQ